MNDVLPARLILRVLVVCGLVGLLLADHGYSTGGPQRKGKGAAGGEARTKRDTRVHPRDGSVLVWIPGGKTVMGSLDGDPDERPPHEVSVEGFWLGRFEVTNVQYAKFLRATGQEEPMFWKDPKFNEPEKPVVGITWEEARDYCEWAGLRLPTESEWEYAASCGKGYRYPTATGTIDHGLSNFAGAKGKDRWDDSPAPVGSFPANPRGLHDMAGNAWEWTSSFYKPYPYVATDGREDASETYGLRVMRGGSWQFPERYCSTSHRRRFESHLRFDSSGFRVALSDEKSAPHRSPEERRNP